LLNPIEPQLNSKVSEEKGKVDEQVQQPSSSKQINSANKGIFLNK